MIITSGFKCLVQTKLNKRRRKRKGKKEIKSNIQVYDRVVHILKTGQIGDYTHPREVDPYWSKLYIQYEYLTYLIIALEKKIKKSNNEYYINELKKDIELLKNKRKRIFNYMFNFMLVLFGAVIKNRFYGWQRFNNEFISLFTEQVIENITKLRFDPDKSRPSIYYYQLFWLAGIGLAKKIKKRLELMSDSIYDTGRGSKLLSNNDNIEEIVSDDEITYVSITDDDESRFYNEDYDTIIENEEQNEEITLQDVLHYILEKAGINSDILYNEIKSNKSLKELGNYIKKLIQNGNIHIPDEYKKVLQQHGFLLNKRSRRMEKN